MSDSDDTDLLLLMPPDFFVVRSSDSEDSLPSSRRHHKHSRVNGLISQVNDLEERVNLIESKDNLNSEKSFSETSKFNQCIDYSVSLDSTNFHNLYKNDLALRFYSVSSAGFRLGSSVDTASIPLTRNTQTFFKSESVKEPPTDSTKVNTRPKSYILEHDVSVNFNSAKDPVVLTGGNSKENREMNYLRKDIKYVTADGTDVTDRINSLQQWQDNSFLSEIDEFLESRNKEASDKCTEVDYSSTANGNQVDIPNLKINFNPSNIAGRPTSSPFLTGSQNFDLSQVDQLLSEVEATHLEIERKLQSKEASVGQQYASRTHEEVIAGSSVVEQNQMPCYSALCRNIRQEVGNSNVYYVSNSEQAQDKDLASQSPYSHASQYNENTEGNTQRNYENTCHPRDSSQLQDLRSREEEVRFESLTDFFHHKATDAYHKTQLDIRPAQEPGNEMFHRVDARCLNTCQNTNCEGVAAEAKIKSTNYEGPPDNRHVASEVMKSISYPVQVQGQRTSSMLHSSKSASICGQLEGSRTPAVLRTELGGRHATASVPACTQEISLGGGEAPEPAVTGSQTGPTANGVSAAVKERSGYYPQYMRKEYVSQEPTQSSAGADAQSKKKVDFLGGLVDHQAEGRRAGLEAVNGMPSKTSRGLPGDEGYFSSIGAGSSAGNLLSLSELWGSEARLPPAGEHASLERRLEEERYRRKHCEGHIQRLQRMLLEEQQKLAVAMQVDQAKDKAIRQLQAAWKRLVAHWQELEDQRNMLSIQLSEAREKHQQELLEMAQKVQRYEIELSKVLDLAQGYKEKGDGLEEGVREQESRHAAERQALEARLEEGQQQLRVADHKLTSTRTELEALQEKLAAEEKRLQNEKVACQKAREDVRRMKEALHKHEADLAAVKQENGSLQLRLHEEKSRSTTADQQRRNLQGSLDEHKKKEKSLREELKEKTELWEKSKLELRDYYQSQVEAVVREKLEEFQAQLDAAETSLNHEMERKEKAALEAANEQIRQLTEKNQLEVQLLEEKQAEERQLHQLQLAQMQAQLAQAQLQLQAHTARRSQIVEKLHLVMETQWQEALRIIAGGSSPVATAPQHAPARPMAKGTKPLSKQCAQIIHNSVNSNLSKVSKSETEQNKDNILDITKPKFRISSLHIPAAEAPKGSAEEPGLSLHHAAQNSNGGSTVDEMPFSQEGQVTYRLNQEQYLDKLQDPPSESNSMLKKYIEMLLDRPPGDPLQGGSHGAGDETPVSDSRNSLKWEKIMEHQTSLCQYSNPSCTSMPHAKCQHTSKDIHGSKRPWK